MKARNLDVPPSLQRAHAHTHTDTHIHAHMHVRNPPLSLPGDLVKTSIASAGKQLSMPWLLWPWPPGPATWPLCALRCPGTGRMSVNPSPKILCLGFDLHTWPVSWQQWPCPHSHPQLCSSDGSFQLWWLLLHGCLNQLSDTFWGSFEHKMLIPTLALISSTLSWHPSWGLAPSHYVLPALGVLTE